MKLTGRVAYDVLPEEVVVIRDACNEWIKENGDE